MSDDHAATCMLASERQFVNAAEAGGAPRRSAVMAVAEDRSIPSGALTARRQAPLVVIAAERRAAQRDRGGAQHARGPFSRWPIPPRSTERSVGRGDAHRLRLRRRPPREIAGLRRLRRELPAPAIVVVSPLATAPGVRRTLDAGADALVFEHELELALVATIRAVASGQSVVPRKVRAGVERPYLSHRERQVLSLFCQGLTNAEIAEPCSSPKARSRATSPRSSPNSASTRARRRPPSSSTSTARSAPRRTAPQGTAA